MEAEVAVEASPTVSCLRCRGQKLKCGRELPSCVRCRKQRAVCKYPSPPDRRRIAQETSRPRPSLSEDVEHFNRYEPSTLSSPPKRQRPNNDNAQKQNSNSESNEDAKLPSTEVGLLLLEVFFKRIYNATLLFHKTVAFQLYMQNGIPAFLLRAIFAHAAIFLEQVDSPYKEHIKIFPVHSLFDKSWSWARSASQEVLSHVDEPSLVKIQALQVLQLYYFSQDDIERAMVHATLAYRLSQLLGYDQLREDFNTASLSRTMQFDREMKRRCFWASWCSWCIGSQQFNSSRLCEKAAGLPLPGKFDKGESGQAVELNLGPKMNESWQLNAEFLPDHGRSASPSCSLMVELVKLLGIWTQIQFHIARSPAGTYSQRTNTFNKIVELLNPIERSIQLPLTEICPRAKFYDESPELLACVCSMYHLGRLLLHASMVPKFSGRPVESSVSSESVRKNAKATLQHAIEFADLFKQFIVEDLDITRLWPISGYGAFMAGSIFLICNGMMRRSTDQSLQIPGPESEEMTTIQTVLKVLSIYWKPLCKLAVKLDQLIDAGHLNDADLITSPTYPWSLRGPSDLVEGYADNTGMSNTTDSNVKHTRAPSVTYLEESQSVLNAARHEHNADFHPPLHQQQTFSQARTNLNKSAPRTTTSVGPSVSLDSFLMNSNEGGLFNAEWWNSTTPIHGCEYPLPANGTPLQDALR